MIPFLLALAVAAAVTLAGREAVRVAQLSKGLGPGAGLFTACWLAGAVGGGSAAWLGSRIGAALGPDATGMFVVVVLTLAGAELALLRPGRVPAEPTRSFGAIAIVLTLAQLTAPASLVVAALAATGQAALIALGGALGSGAVLSAAWRAGGEWEARVPAGLLRWGTAGLLVLAAFASGHSMLVWH